MSEELNTICNYNPKNNPSQAIYDSFNSFIFSNDIRVIGKLLHRFSFFEKTRHLAGDIVEVGVFKGSGVASWLKMIEIYMPHSNRKVIGFDIFDSKENIFTSFKNGDRMTAVLDRTSKADLSLKGVTGSLEATEIGRSKYILVQGDVCVTSKSFVETNPGFRISLLYIDLDLDEPVYHSLLNFWDRIVPGGYIVFDEYEYHKFDESCGVDRFLKDKKIEYSVETTNFIGPTAFMIKKKF
jgi:hypothetical protein